MPRIPNIVKNILKSFIIGIVILFGGLVIIANLVRLFPGDIVASYLPARATPEEYWAKYYELGFHLPLWQQFFLFLGRFFTGQWGFSINVARGVPVIELIGGGRIQHTLEVLLLPLTVGAIAGTMIGLISIKTRKKWLKRIIQILNVLGYAVPVIFLGLFFQFGAYLSGNLPTMHFKNPAYPDPPFVTGFRILDSLISGQWYLAFDTALHYILPGLVLGFTISALVIKVIRINAVNKTEKTSIIYNTARIAFLFGLIFSYAMLVDMIFNLFGFGNLVLEAITGRDYNVIKGCLFVGLIIIVLVAFTFNIIYCVYHYMVEKEKWPTTWIRREKTVQKEGLNTFNQPSNNPKVKERNPNSFNDFKAYFLKKLKSPLTIIGLIFFLFFVLISIFPQILTPYSIEEADAIYEIYWTPPSPAHPLGTTYMGRDVLARAVYGIRESLIFGFLATLIGVGGGLHFGYLANNKFYERKYHKWFIRWVIMGFMLLFYLLPILLFLIAITSIFGREYTILLVSSGVLSIPIFTWIFVKTEYKIFEILKKVIIYIPLFVGFIIIIYNSLGFIGYSDPDFIQLGMDISNARGHILMAPWAVLSPGVAFFLLTLGLFFLHEGFQDYPRHSRY
ncbi:MAG: ABC transporter permease subunit [Promethearchaeota archaeon]